jgi:transposase
VSVFCDLLGKRVLFAVKGRDKKVWEAFVQALEAHNGHPRAIREVSMDMSPSYIAGVRENIGSQAVMVFDKFHVIAHVNDAVNAVRRAELQLGGLEAKKALQGSRWIWLKNPENLTPKQRATQQRIETVNLAQLRGLAAKNGYFRALLNRKCFILNGRFFKSACSADLPPCGPFLRNGFMRNVPPL